MLETQAIYWPGKLMQILKQGLKARAPDGLSGA
jgi:hypothetical protein